MKSAILCLVLLVLAVRIYDVFWGAYRQMMTIRSEGVGERRGYEGILLAGASFRRKQRLARP